MVDNEILNQYREGVRGLLQSGAKEEVRSSVPEFQSIILEEVLSFAQKEIVGVYNCAKVKLLTGNAKDILKEKKVANVHIKVICLPDEGCSITCDLAEIFKQLPSKMKFSDSLLTVVVVDGSVTLAIGGGVGDPLLLYPGGLEDFTQSALKFANDLWTYVDICADEGSHS